MTGFKAASFKRTPSRGATYISKLPCQRLKEGKTKSQKELYLSQQWFTVPSRLYLLSHNRVQRYSKSLKRQKRGSTKAENGSVPRQRLVHRLLSYPLYPFVFTYGVPRFTTANILSTILNLMALRIVPACFPSAFLRRKYSLSSGS